MIREIKFRAWTGKRMMEPSRNMVIDSYDGLVSWSFGGNEPEPLDCTLMQFTGLHDKNGKEIYEGDVLLADMYIRNKWTEGVKLKVVYYSDGVTTQSGFRFERENGDWQYPALLKDIEVIGNIYENPELIKQQDD